MRYLQTYNLFEKSSLTSLGVPNEVMKNVQYNYEIQSDAKWNRIVYKKDVKEELQKDDVALFIEINIKYIKVIINLGNDEYAQQKFMYDDSGWGGYNIKDREDTTRTQILFGIRPESNIYKLDGTFETRPKVQRMIQKEMKKFDDVTNEFKFYMLYNFNRIIQRIYGARYENVMRKIASNIKEVSVDATADEILQFLKDNKKMAEKAKDYENAKKDEDLLRIKDLEKQFNSLPVLDEYLINFEEGYSNKYYTRLTIKDLIDEFGRMKIETAFMFYLFTGKLKELSVQRKK
jgi:hypothetical protein